MNKETQNIEFKEYWRDEYLKWICGFANAQGGTLYIGVDDNGKVCGLHDATKLMEDIPNKVRDLLGILVDVNLKSENGKEYADTIQKTIQKLSRKQEEILLYLKNNPKASRKDLTDNIIDLTEDG